MRDELAAELLTTLLGREPAEYGPIGAHLQAMARLKYDGYEGYRPGEQFAESLAVWLAQFDASEREVALSFVLNDLVMVSLEELEHLIETVYPDVIKRRLVTLVASELGVPDYRVSGVVRSREFLDLQRKTLLLGLADGARIDRLRRASPELSHEQFYLQPELGPDFQATMREHLADAVMQLGLSEPAIFRLVFLVDDFAGSGYTLLSESEDGTWRGKLARADNHLKQLVAANILAPDHRVVVLLYLATEHAQVAIRDGLTRSGFGWQLEVVQSLPATLSVAEPAMLELCERYLDKSLLTDPHLSKSKAPPHLGFGGVALPLVIHHNTPNNSVPLLWSDTSEKEGTDRRHGLFPRRQRHNPDRP